MTPVTPQAGFEEFEPPQADFERFVDVGMDIDMVEAKPETGLQELLSVMQRGDREEIDKPTRI